MYMYVSENHGQKVFMKQYLDLSTHNFVFHVQTRRTVIPLPPDSNPEYDLDLLDIGQYAHVEVEAVDASGDPSPSVRVSNCWSVYTGKWTGT